MHIDLNKYSVFVETITSKESNDIDAMIISLRKLQAAGVNAALAALISTATMGMNGEAGELSEIFKKVIYHGKPFTEETRAHALKELGDIIFYWTNACRALGLDPNQIIQNNMDKLMARYPGGTFDAHYSANRAIGDI